MRPVIRIAIAGRRQSFPAWIDLGFDGDLVVPSSEIDRLGIVRTRERIGVSLDDGSVVSMPIGRVGVRFLGRVLSARALLSDDRDPARDERTGEVMALVGLGLLHGARLTIDLTPGGGILIERPIPPAKS